MHIVCAEPSIANHFLAELRDVDVQRDSLRFRRNLQRLGEIIAYRISSLLSYTDKAAKTPLGTANSQQLRDFPVLATVLRAGLPFHQGFLNSFDQSPQRFCRRLPHRRHLAGTGTGRLFGRPFLDERVLILADPMLATGNRWCSPTGRCCASARPGRCT